MSQEKKYASIHYASYLGLDRVLDAQRPRSAYIGKEAHDEMLFIIIHQVYELWFKQILHEVDSVMRIFSEETTEERAIDLAVHRLHRVNEILALLIRQIGVLETMTPLDFLEFRAQLFPASGFQSFQFRKLEVILGLKLDRRVAYTPYAYYREFSPEQQDEIRSLEASPSLFDRIEAWLERMPFLQIEDFDFEKKYLQAVSAMLERERQAIRQSDYLSEEEKNMRLKMNGDSDTFFANIFNPEFHAQQVAQGNMRISYKAALSALLIQLYGSEPLLQLPCRLLNAIADMDEQLTTWRYRHAQMVLRMLGRKTGTGGSSGHEYLMETARKHQIFLDFHHISTLLIPRSELPELPPSLKELLGYAYQPSTSRNT